MNRSDACVFSMTRLTVVIAALLAPFGTAWPQPFGLDPEAPEPVLIEFKAEPGKGDFVGRVEGSVDASGKRFYLKGINVMAPLVLQVLAKDPAQPVEVSLHRLFWEEVEWRGRTDANGNWGYVGRVYQDVGIQLTAKETAGFYVLAWQGPAVEPEFGLAALAPKTAGVPMAPQETADGSKAMVYAAIAVVVLLFAGLYWRRYRNAGASGTAAIALVCILIATGAVTERAMAQVPIVDSSSLTARLLEAEARIAELSAAMTQVQHDAKSLGDLVLNNAERISENFADITELGIQQAEFAAEAQNQVDRLRAEMLLKDRQHERMIRRLETLIEEDRRAEPDPTVGGATLAASCTWDATTDGVMKKCGACYKKVNDKIASRLQFMEQARILYDGNVSMIRDSVAFGDAASGFHQLEQQKWYEVRRTLQQKNRETHDAYQQYMNDKAFPDLEQWLRELAVCETESGGMEHWFERQGVLFLTLMKTHYARYDNQ